MKYPNFSEEKKLWKKGYKFVVGLDEAGRGPLAGPVVAAAVNLKLEIRNLKIKDSKKLSALQREEIYKILTNHKNIKWGIGVVSEKVIDKINILQATKLAMKKALINLVSRNSHDRENFGTLDFLILDGNFKLDLAASAFGTPSATKGFGGLKQKSIVKGDQKVFSVSAASIIAKVTRDRLMKKYHKKYPQFGFDKHKGYGTKAHFASLEKFGPCKIHRKSFYPVSSYPQARICLQILKEVK